MADLLYLFLTIVFGAAIVGLVHGCSILGARR